MIMNAKDRKHLVDKMFERSIATKYFDHMYKCMNSHFYY